MPDYDDKLSQYIAKEAGTYAIAAPAGQWIPALDSDQLVWLPGMRAKCGMRLRSPIGESKEHVIDLLLQNGGSPADSIDLSHHVTRDLDADAAVVRGMIRKWLSERYMWIQAECGREWVPESIHHRMAGLGFQEIQTGGGCTAWGSDDEQGDGYTLITHIDDPSRPLDPLEQVTVGYYKDTEDEGETRDLAFGDYLAELEQGAAPGGAPASRPDVQNALDLINRHRATIRQSPLDPAVADWGPDDILIEAERIRRLANPFADAKARLLAW